ncbi:aminotransferase class I/II-fold pyridoxal phosphate-dependent enzyme [Actinomadura sp. NPDC048394]|uniref:aminotransferase class I/II-fold pyridoxal phosphate-dependent enzyme n=1 Tax=Actinomadura sp. NPDC048394 TaxID=3158223 RepID=UPI0033DE20E9
MAAVVDIAARHGLLGISDDSWQRFAFDGHRYQPVGAFADRWPHIVTVMRLSKCYALASWRMGYVLAPPPVIDALEDRLQWEAVCCGVVPAERRCRRPDRAAGLPRQGASHTRRSATSCATASPRPASPRP